MTTPERKRIIIDIPSDSLRYSRLYSHMANSPDGLKKKILDACDIQYYPFALIDSKAEQSEILDESIVSVGRLHIQIQVIVNKLRSLGIQPTPEMLTLVQAGDSNQSMPAMPSNRFQAATSPTTPSTQVVITESSAESNEDDDDWAPTEAELAYLKKSQAMDLESNADQ